MDYRTVDQILLNLLKGFGSCNTKLRKYFEQFFTRRKINIQT